MSSILNEAAVAAAFGLPMVGDSIASGTVVESSFDVDHHRWFVIIDGDVSRESLKAALSQVVDKTKYFTADDRVYEITTERLYETSRALSNPSSAPQMVVVGRALMNKIRGNPVTVSEFNEEMRSMIIAEPEKDFRKHPLKKSKKRMSSAPLRNKMWEFVTYMGESYGWVTRDALYHRRASLIMPKLKITKAIDGALGFYHTHPTKDEPSLSSADDYQWYFDAAFAFGIKHFYTVMQDRIDHFVITADDSQKTNYLKMDEEKFLKDIDSMIDRAEAELKKKYPKPGDKDDLSFLQTVTRHVTSAMNDRYGKYATIVYHGHIKSGATRSNPGDAGFLSKPHPTTITPPYVRQHPTTLFIFGDNDKGTGTGGQAAIRNEKNAMGIRTKKAPSTKASAYYTDDEYEENIRKMKEDMELIKAASTSYESTYFIPGIGEGRAKLKEKAPRTFTWLKRNLSKPNPPIRIPSKYDSEVLDEIKDTTHNYEHYGANEYGHSLYVYYWLNHYISPTVAHPKGRLWKLDEYGLDSDSRGRLRSYLNEEIAPSWSNLDVLLLLALYHDVGKKREQETGVHHSEIGAQMFFEEIGPGLHLPQQVTDAVTHLLSTDVGRKGITPDNFITQAGDLYGVAVLVQMADRQAHHPHMFTSYASEAKKEGLIDRANADTYKTYMVREDVANLSYFLQNRAKSNPPPKVSTIYWSSSYEVPIDGDIAVKVLGDYDPSKIFMLNRKGKPAYGDNTLRVSNATIHMRYPMTEEDSIAVRLYVNDGKLMSLIQSKYFTEDDPIGDELANKIHLEIGEILKENNPHELVLDVPQPEPLVNPRHASKIQVVTVSGTSGSGKSTFVRTIAGALNACVVPTVTTRRKRPKETIDGDRVFVSKDKFRKMVSDGEFVEFHKEQNGEYYGRRFEDFTKDVAVVDLTLKGFKTYQKVFPNMFSVFLEPDIGVKPLTERLIRRGGMTPKEARARASIIGQQIEKAHSLPFDRFIETTSGQFEDQALDLASEIQSTLAARTNPPAELSETMARVEMLSNRERKSLLARLAKLMEESGELAEEVLIELKESGSEYKRAGSDGIKGESVDGLLVLLSIFYEAGGDLNELVEIMDSKSRKWASKMKQSPVLDPPKTGKVVVAHRGVTINNQWGRMTHTAHFMSRVMARVLDNKRAKKCGNNQDHWNKWMKEKSYDDAFAEAEAWVKGEWAEKTLNMVGEPLLPIRKGTKEWLVHVHPPRAVSPKPKKSAKNPPVRVQTHTIFFWPTKKGYIFNTIYPKGGAPSRKVNPAVWTNKGLRARRLRRRRNPQTTLTGEVLPYDELDFRQQAARLLHSGYIPFTFASWIPRDLLPKDSFLWREKTRQYLLHPNEVEAIERDPRFHEAYQQEKQRKQQAAITERDRLGIKPLDVEFQQTPPTGESEERENPPYIPFCKECESYYEKHRSKLPRRLDFAIVYDGVNPTEFQQSRFMEGLSRWYQTISNGGELRFHEYPQQLQELVAPFQEKRMRLRRQLKPPPPPPPRRLGIDPPPKPKPKRVPSETPFSKVRKDLGLPPHTHLVQVNDKQFDDGGYWAIPAEWKFKSEEKQFLFVCFAHEISAHYLPKRMDGDPSHYWEHQDLGFRYGGAHCPNGPSGCINGYLNSSLPGTNQRNLAPKQHLRPGTQIPMQQAFYRQYIPSHESLGTRPPPPRRRLNPNRVDLSYAKQVAPLIKRLSPVVVDPEGRVMAVFKIPVMEKNERNTIDHTGYVQLMMYTRTGSGSEGHTKNEIFSEGKYSIEAEAPYLRKYLGVTSYYDEESKENVELTGNTTWMAMLGRNRAGAYGFGTTWYIKPKLHSKNAPTLRDTPGWPTVREESMTSRRKGFEKRWGHRSMYYANLALRMKYPSLDAATNPGALALKHGASRIGKNDINDFIKKHGGLLNKHAYLSDVGVLVAGDDGVGRPVNNPPPSGLTEDFETMKKWGHHVRSTGQDGLAFWNEQKPWIVTKYGADAIEGAVWRQPLWTYGFDPGPDGDAQDFTKDGKVTPLHFLNQLRRIPINKPLSPERILQVAYNIGQGMASGSVTRDYRITDFANFETWSDTDWSESPKPPDTIYDVDWNPIQPNSSRHDFVEESEDPFMEAHSW